MRLSEFAVKSKKALLLLRRHGVRALVARILRGATAGRRIAPSAMFDLPLPPEHVGLLAPKVLIVAELSIPQCRLYRVEQKVNMLESLGWTSAVVSWTDADRCRQEMQTASLVIVYRAPFVDDVRSLYDEAHRLGLRVGFDIDDLVFEVEEYSRNSNVLALPAATRKNLLDGAVLYCDALAAADFSIASTATLADYMRKYCKGPCYVVPNAIGTNASGGSFRFPLGLGGEIVIGYGSGTTTHDKDFAVCAPALLRILDDFPQTVFVLHGTLSLPRSFDRVASRVRRIPFVPFSEYSDVIARFDLNLAPLEPTVFNDCKSNIKFLEAAQSSVPTVASPCAEFADAIQDGENGFLATNEEEWFMALKRLVESSELRRAAGAAAKRTAQERYSIASVARHDFKRLLEEQAVLGTVSDRRRILVVNVLYAPVSFGGATVLTENLVKELSKRCDIAVFTSTMDIHHAPGSLTRYSHAGTPCFVCEIEPPVDEARNYESPPDLVGAFREVVRSFRPDVVHFNSIQFMGVEMLAVCRELQVPYFVTVHDAWWICPRQFMLDGDNRYCGQDETGIDLYRCASCCGSKDLFSRFKILYGHLCGAAAILAPSDYQRDLYVKTGFPQSLVHTNHNGITMPEKTGPHVLRPILTFAYLGGKCYHKGYFMLQRIVRGLHGDYRIKVVDVNLRFGTPSISAIEWPEPSKIEVCKPFDPDTIDAFYEGVDVLLLPSDSKESFGLTVREALARNIWVVATDVGGDVSRDLRNGENGDLLSLGDEAGFAAAMQRLIDNPERLAGFENLYRKSITTVARQAEEVLELLSDDLGWQNSDYASAWAVQSSAVGDKGRYDKSNSWENEKLAARCAKLKEESARFKRMYDTISTSTCWRLTGPIRAMIDAVKKWVRKG